MITMEAGSQPVSMAVPDNQLHKIGGAPLQSQVRHAILTSTNGWIRCPRCRKKIARVMPISSGIDVVVTCSKCGIDWITPINQNPVPQRPDSKD